LNGLPALVWQLLQPSVSASKAEANWALFLASIAFAIRSSRESSMVLIISATGIPSTVA
jgi:hypothetical protein